MGLVDVALQTEKKLKQRHYVQDTLRAFNTESVKNKTGGYTARC